MPINPNPIPENKPIPGSKPFPTNKPDIPNVDISEKSSDDAHKRIEHVADKAAHKAAKREQEFDKQQTTISK
jgi:hypothetical protein